MELMRKGIDMGATAIALDAGSTDSGPSYLGTGTAKTSAAAVERDLRTAIVAGREAGIPVLVGSCGTAGTDGGVDWMAEMAGRIAKEEQLSFKLARIYSEQDPEFLVEALRQGRIHPLAHAAEADAATLRSCEHIVALMGHEPMAAALAAGADVVLAGRATDTAMVAAVALSAGLPPGPVWHAAKTVECGGLCTTNPRAAGGSSPVYVEIDMGGFTVTPLHEAAACTPRTVAAHMLYENADPFRLLEPTGALDTSMATYTAVDPRVVRVEGSQFEASPHPTAKLEGSRKVGYETVALVGIADPHILSEIEVWMERVMNLLTQRVRSLLRLEPGQYAADLRCYGYNAVLGDLAPRLQTPAEVGVLLKVRAEDQATATAIAKVANPLLLHQPLPTMDYLPSLAFVTSPAEIERGAVYEFALNHVVDMTDGSELFRTTISEVTGA
jgi:hypothetical protein